MKVAIMQPYLFPYIGYFQLINWSDIFVLYNDVQFIKGGWINRNNIAINGQKHMFYFSLDKASTYSLINERKFEQKKIDFEINKFKKTIFHAYSKANHFEEVNELINIILDSFDENLAKTIHLSLVQISNYLELKSKFVLSENITYDRGESAQNKVIGICKSLQAREYANPIGGLDLYNKTDFNTQNIKLHFLKCKKMEYNQTNKIFIPNLSIIDVLMHNGKDGVKKLLEQYDLV